MYVCIIYIYICMYKYIYIFFLEHNSTGLTNENKFKNI